MAKSRKSSSNRKTGAKGGPSKVSKTPPEDIVDAEIVVPDDEPMEHEVEELSATDLAKIKDDSPAEAAKDLADAVKNDAADVAADIKETATDAADAGTDAATEVLADGAEAAQDTVDEAVTEATTAADKAMSDTAMSDTSMSNTATSDAGTEASTSTPPVAAAPTKKSGGTFGSILGGLIAAAIGFLASMWFFPEGWKEKDDSVVTSLQDSVAGLTEGLETQTGKLQELAGQVSELGGSLDGVKGSLDQVTADLTSGLTERGSEIAAVADRLQRLTEGEGMVALPDDVQLLLNAQKEQIEGLASDVTELASSAKDRMDALSDEVAAMTEDAKQRSDEALAQQAEADRTEARVKARAALQAVELALTNGEAFDAALADIAPATDIPEDLTSNAAGVATVAQLISDYPALARTALAAAGREDSGDSTGGRLAGFFKDQLGARSLTPQDGDSTDAVLSRAEAAIKAEDLTGALAEITALKDTPKEVFADWAARAEARQAAISGYQAVADALNEN